MKKFLISAVAVVLILTCSLTLLGACTREETDYDHTIVFYSQQGQTLRNVTAEVITEFEAEHPGWKIEHDTSAGSWDGLPKLITSDIGNGNQPDIAYCYPDHVASYLSTRTVVDLNKYWDSEETFGGETLGFTDAEQDDFIDVFMEDGMADNFSNVQQYGYADDALLAIPFVKSTELLYYNTDALKAMAEWLWSQNRKDDAKLFAEFDANGKVTKVVPADTWDVMWKQCKLVKEHFPNVRTFTYDSEANWFITACKQNGWNYTSKDESEHYTWRNQTGLETFLSDLYTQYQNNYFITALTLDPSGQSYTSDEFTKGVGGDVDNGEGGGAIYCIGSSGGASYQNTNNFTVGIAPIPGTKTKVNGNDVVNYSAISQGPSFCMFRGGHGVSNPDEKEKMTWLFMKKMLSPKWQVRFSQANGYNPSRESAYDYITGTNDDGDSVTYGALLDEASTTVTKATALARTLTDRFFTSPAFDGSSTARNMVETVIVNVLAGNNPKQVLQKAYEDCGGLN